jgi:Domain of unknown function (DUF4402)
MNGSLRLLVLAAGFLASGSALAGPDCQLCAPTTPLEKAIPRRALHIEVDSLLDFSTAAHRDAGDGAIEVDPVTGLRRVTGGLIGLGGPALKGVARLTGEPFARVKVDVPRMMMMRSTTGAVATISNIKTSLSSDPALGGDGTLTFSFGGRMVVADGAAGEFHGRFPIAVDYQ